MKSSLKILVLGYFGYLTDQLDGQTVKTRNMYELLESKQEEINSNVTFFDTQTFQRSKFNLLKMFIKISRCNVLIYLPAHNNLKYIFPFIFIWCKLFKIKIHYIIIGGWLGAFLENKMLHRYLLSKIDGIYSETSDLSKILKTKYRLNNVMQLHNYRITDFEDIDIQSLDIEKADCNLVFMARIHPQKGVRTIFKLENELTRKGIKNISIDMYGPIFEDFKPEFKNLLEQSKIVKYKGILKTEEINKTLSHYSLMLFPTQYYTEGFPGSILDAYISGVPVVASNWKYATEFIEDNISGLISDFNNEEQFIEKVLYLIENKEEILRLKKGAIEQRTKYSPESAWNSLKINLEKYE
jgi:glycosyltransferase involved in cell wall biosynthesis